MLKHVLAVPLIASGAFAGGLAGNIPASRLADKIYSSPDGGFELTLPPLVTPGAKGEERQLDPGSWVVAFMDDFGAAYYILRTDNAKLNFDLDKVAAGYEIKGELLEKQIVATDRGSELRLASFRPGGSPLVSETKVKRKTTRTKLDLHQAMSFFIAGPYIYEVSAAVTRTSGQPDAEMLARAKGNLDSFLAGLRIKPQPSPAP